MNIFQQSFKSNLLSPISYGIGKGRFFVLLLLLASCTKQTEQFYTNKPARFHCLPFQKTVDMLLGDAKPAPKLGL